MAWGSQLLYLRTGLTAHQSQRSVGEGAAIPPASLSTSAEIFGVEGWGKGHSLMLFYHVLSKLQRWENWIKV